MIMRCEHPKPQFERENWISLNGEWDFAFDFSNSGIERKMYVMSDENSKLFDKKINVPFCPESRLSKIEYRDFIPACWYRRVFNLDKLEGRTIVHFGAVDWECHVYINGNEVGVHKGGYTSFSFDISEFVVLGENTITVCAIDDVKSSCQASGKQSQEYISKGTLYTRTTGIWQSVWLEFVPENYVKRIKFTPDIDNKCVFVEASVIGCGELCVSVKYQDKAVGEAKAFASGDATKMVVNLEELHLWECGNGRLYDVTITYGKDRVKSYFGMRKVALDKYRFMLNDKPVFLRTVLDQGFYPDGIYTAPSDEALSNDIKLAMAAGFNGARLHEKIFEERFLYHADRAGFLVFGEYPNWGLDVYTPEAFHFAVPEWIEAVERDYNHPSIVIWCPLNETWGEGNRKMHDSTVKNIYTITKTLDPTRPCIDTSGNYHVKTDIYDVHCYEQNLEVFSKRFENFPEDTESMDYFVKRQHYKKGQPLFVGEYGGIAFASVDKEGGWGYGSKVLDENDFLDRFRGLTETLLFHPFITGFCYTQLYDIEQERNGLCTYDRVPKFDLEIIKKIVSQKAAIEE